MEFEKMSIEELETRRAAIATECEVEGADLDALTEEVRGINAELEARRNAAAQKAEIRAAVASGEGVVVETMKEEKGKDKMTIEEVRSSKAYIDAYANYLKTEKDEECRALLTELANVEGASGPLPVPTIVEGRIRTAWDKLGVWGLIRKTYVKGILKVGFEVSSTPAAFHVEGDEAPAEEKLVLGVATLTPVSIKKYIHISDEAMDLSGEEFLDYIYDELAYRIAKAAEDSIIGAIGRMGENDSAAVGVLNSDGSDILSIVAKAVAKLSDEAASPVVVMNKATYAAFKTAQANAQYGVDPFDGLPVYFNSTLSALSETTSTTPWLIVGDFGIGAQANFPNGAEIKLKFDDLSEAESDLVKVVGRMYMGFNVVAPHAFCKVVNQ